MALVRPFRAVRPTKDKAALVAALPYDVMNSDEARVLAADNPYSFLHIDKAEIDLDKNTDPYSSAVYEKAAENLEKMCKNGILIQDEKPCFYIYRLTMNNHSQTGLVCCTSVDEYINGTIKKHELTRTEKEIDRIKHVSACNANTGPIFLAYRAEKAAEIIENITAKAEPVYNFACDDGVTHTVWLVDDNKTINEIADYFSSVPSLYIADGHHRNASAVKVALEKRAQNPSYTGNEEFNYYLSVIFPSCQLRIMDYNRVVKDLNGLSQKEFMARLEEKFQVTPFEGKGSFKPSKPHQFGMYTDGKWYILDTKDKFIPTNAVDALDVSVLYNNVLAPLLGIGDARTDKRIDFIGGIRGLSALEKEVDSQKAALAFSMYPTSMEELMKIADSGGLMPPKSTWFEPKLRSGLFIHSLD